MPEIWNPNDRYILQAPPPTATMFTTELEYDGDKISGYAGSAFKAGTDLEFGYDSADNISAINNSALTDASLNNIVQTNSGAWGGSALPISAGPGIKVNLVDNTLVFSNDETVLWTNNNPGQISAGITLTGSLTESCSAFETIRFVCKGSCDTNESWVCPLQFQDFSYNTANASNQAGIYLPIRIGSTIYRDSCMITMNDNTFTANNGSRLQGLASMTENTSRGPYILQVIGLNRK